MSDRPPPDIALAVDDGFRWMSYAEIGAARGISAESAARLTLRKKWRRQAGNSTTVLIAVPLTELERTARRRTLRVRPRQAAASAPGQGSSSAPDISRIVSGLEAALATVREQLERERTRADAAEGRADRAGEALAGERSRADLLRDRQDALQAELRQAWEAVAELRQAGEGARQAGGLLARLRAALRGA